MASSNAQRGQSAAHGAVAGVAVVLFFAVVPACQLALDHARAKAAIASVLARPEMRAIAATDRQLACRADTDQALSATPQDRGVQYVACVSPAEDKVWSFDVRTDSGKVFPTQQLDSRLLETKFRALMAREHNDNLALITDVNWSNAPLRNELQITVDKQLWEKEDPAARADLIDTAKGYMRRILLDVNAEQPIRDATYRMVIVDQDGDRLAED
ncbi:MAG: hypothetical protein M3T49_02565 [Candidatus Eremiobacteraeota bacterium]|nr:hypothetical protein [Candidatus Eremiobacteraeota bacterium]